MKSFENEVIQFLDKYNWKYSYYNKVNIHWDSSCLYIKKNMPNIWNHFSEIILKCMLDLANDERYNFFTNKTLSIFKNNMNCLSIDSILIKDDGEYSIYGVGWTFTIDGRTFGIRFQEIDGKYQFTDLYENFPHIKPEKWNEEQYSISACAGIQICENTSTIKMVYPPGVGDKYNMNNELTRKHTLLSIIKNPPKFIYEYMKAGFQLFAESYKEELNCNVYYFVAPKEVTYIAHKKLRGLAL